MCYVSNLNAVWLVSTCLEPHLARMHLLSSELLESVDLTTVFDNFLIKVYLDEMGKR